jgi:nucleotide-binding universal stress UspA family protein
MREYFPKKILLATDGSAQATLAARRVAKLAKTSGSELHVVTFLRSIHT